MGLLVLGYVYLISTISDTVVVVGSGPYTSDLQLELKVKIDGKKTKIPINLRVKSISQNPRVEF